MFNICMYIELRSEDKIWILHPLRFIVKLNISRYVTIDLLYNMDFDSELSMHLMRVGAYGSSGLFYTYIYFNGLYCT